MKFRLTVTAVREYRVNPANYSNSSVEAMLKTDKEVIAGDCVGMLDYPDTTWDIQVERV